MNKSYVRLTAEGYNKESLKINGVYIHTNPDSRNLILKYLFFYKNGVVLVGFSSGPIYKDEFETHVDKMIIKQNYNEYIYGWGKYLIKGKEIKIEKYESPSGGRIKTVEIEGEILNDKTFILTKKFSNYNNKTYSMNDTFRYEHFSPKPDSTNQFID